LGCCRGELKEGDNEFIFADNPNQDLVPQHVTIKTSNLMARGRALRAEGKIEKKKSFTIREAEMVRST
jgi:hypothetical protein